MEEKIVYLNNARVLKIRTVIPHGSDEGFFLVSGLPSGEPELVNEISIGDTRYVARRDNRVRRRAKTGWEVLMPDGSWRKESSVILDSAHFMAGNEPLPVNALEYKLAVLIKKLVEENSMLIKVGTPGLHYFFPADLCQAFNTDLGESVNERTMVNASTIKSLCRDLGLNVGRNDNGWRVALETKSLCEMAERYGLGEMNYSLAPGQDFLGGDLK